MPDLGGDTVWVAASFLLAIVLAAVLVGVAQLVIASRCEEESQRTPWRAMITIAMLAGSLAVGIGVAAEGVIAAIAGAALGARFAWRHDFRGSPQHVALRGSGVGLAAMLGGFARYLSSTSCGEWACAEVYAAVFVGALIFAVSATGWCISRGWLIAQGVVHPGTSVVNLTALLLCVWMGYGFVTEHAQPFGLAVLLAMSLLATALGAHLMMSAGAARGRYAFVAGLGQRSMVRCGVVPRRSVLNMVDGFEWPDDHMPALFDDDFAQSWSPLDDSHLVAETLRVGACRCDRSVGHATTRGERGRDRWQQRNRGAAHPGARYRAARTESGDESGE
jgi:H+-translocating NAD(P) transhydrogenase subunit beta